MSTPTKPVIETMSSKRAWRVGEIAYRQNGSAWRVTNIHSLHEAFEIRHGIKSYVTMERCARATAQGQAIRDTLLRTTGDYVKPAIGFDRTAEQERVRA